MGSYPMETSDKIAIAIFDDSANHLNYVGQWHISYYLDIHSIPKKLQVCIKGLAQSKCVI